MPNVMADAYIECALWAGQDWSAVDDAEPNPVPLDENYGITDVSNRAEVEAFVDAFAADNADALAVYVEAFSWESAGHDLYLTRNRHGAGFWDRTYQAGPVRDACMALTEAAHACGESEEVPSGETVALGI